MLSSSLRQVIRRSPRDPRARVSIVEVRTPIQTHTRPATQNARLTAYPLQGEIGATVRRCAPTSGLLVVGVTPTGNRDAGKFAADTTQLPTDCQPESLAKPARRRSHV